MTNVTESVGAPTWNDVKTRALEACKGRTKEYLKRLKFEFNEIEKQGAGDYWLGIVNSGQIFGENPNNLVLPFLIGLTQVDPISVGSEHIVEYQPDFPDIDIDFLPAARERIKSISISGKSG